LELLKKVTCYPYGTVDKKQANSFINFRNLLSGGLSNFELQ
jgi:hypothetical protein